MPFVPSFMHSRAGLCVIDLLIQKPLLSNMLSEDLSVKKNPSEQQILTQSPALRMNNYFLLSFSGVVKCTFSSPGLFGGMLYGSVF